MTNSSIPTTADQLAAKRRDQVKSALGRYRVMAYFVGVFLLILCAEMVYKYLLGPWLELPVPSWIDVIAIIHGWAYVVYLLFAVDLGVKVRWGAKRFLLTMLAGTIPLLSFYFEAINTREIRAKFNLT